MQPMFVVYLQLLDFKFCPAHSSFHCWLECFSSHDFGLITCFFHSTKTSSISISYVSTNFTKGLISSWQPVLKFHQWYSGASSHARTQHTHAGLKGIQHLTGRKDLYPCQTLEERITPKRPHFYRYGSKCHNTICITASYPWYQHQCP